MKRILKYLGILVLGIVALIIIGLSFIGIRGIPSYEVEPISYNVNYSQEAFERGQALTMTLYAGCHLNGSRGTLSGQPMVDVPAEFGPVYAPNITQSAEHGIGDWTEGDIVRLLRTGIKRDGSYAPPWMAKLPHMPDQDMNALLVYLTSDALEVKADEFPDQPCEPSFLSKVLCNTVMKPFPMPNDVIAHPDVDDPIAHGRYLAVNMDCFPCHSPDFKTVDYLDPENTPGYFSGGNTPLDLEGKVRITMNLTPDMETGIGSWTKEEFVKAVKYGQKEGEPALRYPMQPYVHLTDSEVEAIYSYLMSIPAIDNITEREL